MNVKVFNTSWSGQHTAYLEHLTKVFSDSLFQEYPPVISRAPRDEDLFPHVDFCINLGGISNLSLEKNGQRIAFDCSPFNLLLNREAVKLGSAYDQDGAWARAGNLNQTLLAQLNALSFYGESGAKSLGRESIDQSFIPLLDQSGLSPKDQLCTLVEHFAIQIAALIRTHSSKVSPSVLLTGGGAYNRYFVERLDQHLNQQWVQVEASKELVEFKEALIFAFLGVIEVTRRGKCTSICNRRNPRFFRGNSFRVKN